MSLTWLIGPAVVAAVIAAIVSVIGFLMNRATVRRMHTEMLAFDEKQAERRVTAEIALAKRKGDADIDLAEKKLAIDQALALWKRRVDLAEETLADFYRARAIIDDARSPVSLGGEGHTRQREPGETEEAARLFDSYYRTVERLTRLIQRIAGIQKRVLYKPLSSRHELASRLSRSPAICKVSDVRKARTK